MAESQPSRLDSVKRRQRKSSSNNTDDIEKEELGRFAHRLSLDVTHDALVLASHNGAIPSEESHSETVEENEISSADRPQSLPNTPAGGDVSTSRLAEAPSLDDCHKHQHRNPVGKIRDVSRTLAKWLRFKSKSINGLSERGEGVHVDPPWRPWRKSVKGARNELCTRALPPVPAVVGESGEVLVASDVEVAQSRLNNSLEGLMPGEAYMPDDEDEDVPNFATSTGNIDFTASIEKVKSYGWYWGPISGEAAERLLLNEPDGSFVVRDSSDDHYIFSLTFKLNGTVRHVRIEHDQGNFSFGSFTRFKSNTIVEFIENAVEHSRSGRYLFFLHRRPVFGPMRVQLLHPVSRFKQVQSLQHLCRFVILKLVPRDLLYHLPVPKRLREYLNTPFYYCEAIADWTDEKNLPTTSSQISDLQVLQDEADTEDEPQTSQPEGEESAPVHEE